MDINKISFSIQGSATSASKAIEKLVKQLDILNTSFSNIAKSGEGAVNILSSIASLSGSASTGMAGMKTSATKVGKAMSGVTSTATTTATAVDKVSKSTKATSTSVSTAIPKVNKLGTMFSSLHKNTTTSTGSMGKLIQRITQITFVIYVARRAFSTLGDGVRSAIAYVENLNLFMVALGENTFKASAFIKEMASSLYLDEAQLTRVQGLFYQISEALGLGADKSLILSENFTKLAYDLASFYNINIEDAVTKLQAGLVGETEPLRRIGIIITENNLAETARNIGIKKSIRNMTEQEKIQLRYITALQQTKNAQGDLARTLQQPENLLRIMREQFHVLMRELGNVAIPFIQRVTPQVIGLTMALSKLAVALAKTLGYNAPELRNDLGGYMKTVADESEDIEATTGQVASNLAKVLKYTKETSTSMAGIDELNVLSSSSSVSGFDSLFPAEDLVKATNSIDEALADYNNRMTETKGIFDKIEAKWTGFFGKLKVIFTTSREAISELINTIFTGEKKTDDEFMGGTLTFFTSVNEIITGIVTGITKFTTKLKTLWDTILKPILEFIMPDWMTIISDGTLAEKVTKLTELFLGWKAITFGAGVLASLGKLVTLGGNIGMMTGLTTLFTAMNAIKIAFEIKDAIVSGEWEDLRDKILNGIILGLATFGLTGSVKAGMLAFNIGVMLDFNIQDMIVSMSNKLLGEASEGNPIDKKIFEFDAKVREGLQKINDNFQLSPIGRVLGGFDLVGATIDLIKGVKGFANGGTPQKGSLFIAGEAGAELVGDLGNGGTSVVNKKQIQELGIPQFAGGVNVPKWTREEQVNSKISAGKRVTTSGESAKDHTASFNKMFDGIGQGVQTAIEATGKGVVDVFKFISPSWLEKSVGAIGKGVGWVVEKTISGGKALGKLGGGIVEDASIVGEGFVNSKVGQALGGAFLWFKSQLDDSSTIIGGTFKGMKNLSKGIADVISGLYTMYKGDKGLQEVMNTPSASGGTTKQQQGIAGQALSGMLGDTGNIILGLAQSLVDGTLLSFVTSLPTFVEAGFDLILNLIDGIIVALPELIKAIPLVIKKIVEILTNKDTLNNLINGVIQIVAMLAMALPDIILALVDAIPDIINTLIDVFIENLPMFFKIGVLIASAIVEGLVNIIIGGINWLIDQINRIPFVNIGHLKAVSWTAKLGKNMGFADGGYPMQGQMFIAREAGAELVGNVGGRTGVVNNDQIVEAVSNGVYRAVSQALGEQGNKEMTVYLDGKKVSQGLTQANKNLGLAFGTGGY